MPLPHESYMLRCLDLAKRGLGETLTNPMVGCVIVENSAVIGEGWHHKYGEAHAERNAISALGNYESLGNATLYVNLEPCAHHGKTPPCAELIVSKGIQKVVYGMADPFAQVNGKGLDYLRDHGVEVVGPVLENECKRLNKRFITFHTKKRPYIILKWAQSADGFMAPESLERLQISGSDARKILHQWRTEEGAVLVGAGTVQKDSPQLNVRYWPGHTKYRIFLDGSLRNNYPDSETKTLVYNRIKNENIGNTEFVLLAGLNLLPEVIANMYDRGVASVLVEGGMKTLQHFFDADLWDEIRVIESKEVLLGNGLAAPLVDRSYGEILEMETDVIKYYFNDLALG